MAYKFQNAITHLSLTRFNNILSLIALTFATLLLNTFLFNHNTIYKELSLRETEAPLVAYVNDTVVEEDARVFANQIQKNEHIEFIEFISKDENLNRAEKQFGPLGRLIKNEFSESNPFPASLAIHVDSDSTSRKTLEQIVFDIESYETIDDVIFTGHGILRDIYRDTNRMTIAGIALTVLFSFLLIRISILKTGQYRNEEIHLLNLIGATQGHLRMPFIIHGVFLGFLGSVLGIICFYLLYSLFIFQLGVLEFIPYIQLIAIVGTGVVIGIVSGISAFRKYANTYRKKLVT